MTKKRGNHGVGNFKPTFTDRFWSLDCDAYARACRFLQIALSDVTRDWAKERKQKIREKWPNQQKVFDRIDRDYEQ